MRRRFLSPPLAAGLLIVATSLAAISTSAGASGAPSGQAAARPSAAEATKCATAEPATWMGCLAKSDPAFGNIPISALALPGSDNAGTFNLDPESFDTQKGSSCTSYARQDDSLGKVFARWSETQDETITEQLDQGVRFIELQVAYNGNGSPETGWRVVQSEYSEFPLRDYLDQVAIWAKAHPSEVVIVQLGNICYDNKPTKQVDAGLYSNFATPSDFGGGPTLADVAFNAASPSRTFATTTIDDVVKQAGGGHNVVLLIPDGARQSQALSTKYHIHPVLTVSTTGASPDQALPVAVASPGVAPAASSMFASGNSQLASYPLKMKPTMGSLVGKGLYQVQLAYSFDPHEQQSLFGNFGGLVEAYSSSKGTLPPWEEGLWHPSPGAESRNQILAKWGHRANVVLADGVENDGYVAAVIRLNAQ